MAKVKIADIAADSHSYGSGTKKRQRASNAQISDRSDLEPNPPVFLTPNEVAARWRVSLRTLERWRLGGTGPSWISIGGGIRYAAEAVFDHEQRQRLVRARAVGGGS